MSHVSESHANAIAQGSPTQGASDLRQCPFLSLSALSRWALQLCLRKMCLGFPSLPTSLPMGRPVGEGGQSEPLPPRPSSPFQRGRGAFPSSPENGLSALGRPGP